MDPQVTPMALPDRSWLTLVIQTNLCHSAGTAELNHGNAQPKRNQLKCSAYCSSLLMQLSREALAMCDPEAERPCGYRHHWRYLQ